MDQKPNSALSSGKAPSKSSKALQELRAFAAASSAEMSNGAGHASDKVSNADQETKDQFADKAQEAKGEIVDAVDDAKETGSRMADKVQLSGQKAVEATRVLATTAINVAGDKVRQVQGRIDIAKSTANDYIHEDPVRAVTYTAIGSAVLTAALIGIFRRR